MNVRTSEYKSLWTSENICDEELTLCRQERFGDCPGKHSRRSGAHGSTAIAFSNDFHKMVLMKQTILAGVESHIAIVFRVSRNLSFCPCLQLKILSFNSTPLFFCLQLKFWLKFIEESVEMKLEIYCPLAFNLSLKSIVLLPWELMF